MVKRNVIDDLGTLFKLSSKQTTYIVNLIIDSICEAIKSAKAQGESVIVLDLGVSTLSINVDDGTWKSMPSKTMKASFMKSVEGNGQDLLIEDLSEIISNKLISIINEAN